MEKENTIYIQGGLYNFGTPQEYFALVSPTGKDSLPYIWKSQQRAKWLTKHHSHSYRVNIDDTSTVYLVEKSWEARGVGAPKVHKLNNTQHNKLKEAIEKNIYYD